MPGQYAPPPPVAAPIPPPTSTWGAMAAAPPPALVYTAPQVAPPAPQPYTPNDLYGSAAGDTYYSPPATVPPGYTTQPSNRFDRRGIP